MVVVEGRKPQCWHCKQVGHFSRSCPQKTTNTTVTTTSTALTTATTSLVSAKSTTTSTVPSTKINKTQKTNIADTQPKETGDDPNYKEEEGWTKVTRGKKFPSKAPKSTTAKAGENKNTEGEKRKPTERPKTEKKVDTKIKRKKKGKNK